MLLLLGGFLGSGRAFLAHDLALRHGFFQYDLDRKKPRSIEFDEKGRTYERILHPKTDPDRMRVYDAALRDMSMLSKLYADVVISDAFHRKAPREHFIDEVKRFFDVEFICVDSSQEHVTERIERMARKRMIASVEEGWGRREHARSTFEPFDDSVLTFLCPFKDEQASARLLEIVRARV